MIYKEVWERYGDPSAFVARLLARMAEHAVRQQELAERAGYHPSHVSRWLREKVPPSLKTMLHLDEAMDQLVADKLEAKP